MLSKIAVGFMLIGLLTACNPESANLDKEAVPLAISSPLTSPGTVPIPQASAFTNPSDAPVPLATIKPLPSPTTNTPSRCTPDGKLTYEHFVPRKVIETRHEFHYKDILAPRFMCHNSNNDTLIITNHKEVLTFDPKTSKIEILIDENITGFSSDQGKQFRLDRLGECVIDKKDNLYVGSWGGGKAYRIDLSNKRITTLQYTRYDGISPTTDFGFPIRLALTPEKQALLANEQAIFRLDDSTLIPIFRANPFNDRYYNDSDELTLPQSLNSALSIMGLESIDDIATDNKGNIYMTTPKQKGLLKLTPEKKVFQITPLTDSETYFKSFSPSGIVSTLEYAPKYNVFFDRGPVVITRDGCSRTMSAPPDSEDTHGSLISDVTSTNDGSVYIFDAKKMRISRLEIPPDLPEKAQWEPPQAWKDATGME